VTQNVYGKDCWEEREDAVTQAVEAMTNAANVSEIGMDHPSSESVRALREQMRLESEKIRYV
jgi:hypothetical protein